MDERLKHGLMGPPALTNPNPNQNQINAGNNNNTNKNSSQSSKRIINKIPLDFNKLKQAGLDRKLAEALSKRNNKSDKNPQKQQESLMSPACSSSSSSSAITSGEAAVAAAKTTTITSFPTQQPQQQQQHQETIQMSQRLPAPQPIKKRSFISNYIEKIVPETNSTGERSLHVKAMLKNRILNKQATTTTSDGPDDDVGAGGGGTTYIYQTPSNFNSTPPADFTVPIAKADLTVRPKKPPVVLNLVNQLPKHRTKCLQLPTDSNQPSKASSTVSTTSAAPSVKSPSPPLIVLENKVLAPNEKINLSDLRLPTRSMAVAAAAPTTTDATAQLRTLSSSSSISSPSGGGIKTKVILNANKLKVSREKLAEIAKEVREQVKQVEQKPKASPSYKSLPSTSTSLHSSLISPVLLPKTLFPTHQAATSPVAPPPPALPLQDVSEEQPSTTTSPSDSLITPISVCDSTPPTPVATPEVKPKILSAVDLIAQLTANDPNYENSFMELSPEELEMSLHFGYTAPVRKSVDKVEPEAESKPKSVPLSVSIPATEHEPKEDLAIGNIVNFQDIDILHATMMDVDGDQSNILRISPNAIKLQSMPVSKEEEEPKMSKDVESNTMRVTKIHQNSEKDLKPQLKLSETSKTIKIKKAKINLVTRNKKPPIKETQETHNGQKEGEEEKEKEKDKEEKEKEKKKEQSQLIDEEPKTESSIVESKKDSIVDNDNSLIQNPSEEIQTKSSSERDLTQLYHPPKMPKHKHNSNNNNNNNNNNNINVEETPQASNNNVSLIDILQQEPPPLQGEAQVPFRKEEENETENEPQTETDSSKPSEDQDQVLGIQNLLSHLKAENITTPPASKAGSISSPASAKVMPRKKLVKTRPFLAKRSSKSSSGKEEQQTAPIFPRNGSLLGENQMMTNGTSKRVTSSSTSDDDGLSLGAFPSKGKRVKVHETDISDDATPDYDETEGETEPQLAQSLPEEKPKTNVKLEENKIDVPLADDSNSLDNSSHHSWSEELPTEEPAAAPKSPPQTEPSDEEKVRSLISVIDPPIETGGISADEDFVAKILPETLNDSSVQESVIINQEMDKATEINDADVKPKTPKKKSPKNKNKSDALNSPELEKIDDLMDTSKDKATTVDKKMISNKAKETKDETPSTSKARINSPVRDPGTKQSEETETEEKATEIIEKNSSPAKSKRNSHNKQNDEDPSKTPLEADSKSLENEPTMPLITPKRRGRKPKSAKTPQIPEQGPEEAAVVQEEQPQPSIVPPITSKRRGRKPRSLLMAEAAQPAQEDAAQEAAALTEAAAPAITPKRRGRKPRNSVPEAADVKQEEKEEPKPATVTLPVITPKRRGRKPRNLDESLAKKAPEPEPQTAPETEPEPEAAAVVGDEQEEAHTFATPLNKPPPKRRGRKPRNREEPPAKRLKLGEDQNDENNETAFTPNSIDPGPQSLFNLRLLLIRNREQLESDEELREEGRGSGPLQCGLCLVRSSKADWQNHLDEHYGIGWTTDEMPTSVSRSVIITLMGIYLKENKEKGCICRLCGRKLSSALGMVGHLENCGTVPQRFECEYCKRKYSKLSLIQHQRSCSKRFQPQETEANVDNAEQGEAGEEKEPVYSNSGRAKRRSTIKAETKLKKIRVQLQTGDELHNGNDFEGDSSDYDMNKDKESSEEYESDDDVNSSLADETEVVDSTNKRSKSGRRQVRRGKATPTPTTTTPTTTTTTSRLKTNIFSRYRILGDVVTKKWKQFIKFNYAKDSLYADYLPSYVKLPWTEGHELLLKSRQSKSMRFAYDKVNDECDWRELKPLEAIKAKNEYITYLGAPIMQLEWAPLPSNVSEQYLLCSLRRKMHGYTRKNDAKEQNALMMLLKCTLETKSNTTGVGAGAGAEVWPLQANLHYAIRVPKGPVFSFAFMPSGGYIESSNRLGLLAVATASSDVQIYALPLQVATDEVKPKGGIDLVIELNSLMTLCLDMNGSVQDPCTKVCWSEGSGHGLLVSGYASGNVALWDIADTEGLNCFKRNNHCSFVPLHYFFLGEQNIQILNLHYDMSGPRWLAVGTSTRKLRVYDIANYSQPMPLVGDGAVNNFFRGCITWPPIWENIAIGCSSVFQIRFTRLLLLNPCGLLYNTKSLDYVLYTARDIHFNCQENYVSVVTENGDLVFVNPREMNMDPVIHKVTYNCRAVSSTELAKLSGGESPPQKETSLKADDFQRDYGVIIKPLIAMPREKKDDYLIESRRQTSELMSMTRLNVVRCNSNRLATNWVAVGAEHGMLRFLHFQRKDFF